MLSELISLSNDRFYELNDIPLNGDDFAVPFENIVQCKAKFREEETMTSIPSWPRRQLVSNHSYVRTQ